MSLYEDWQGHHVPCAGRALTRASLKVSHHRQFDFDIFRRKHLAQTKSVYYKNKSLNYNKFPTEGSVEGGPFSNFHKAAYELLTVLGINDQSNGAAADNR